MCFTHTQKNPAIFTCITCIFHMLHLSVYVHCFISQWCNIIMVSHAESLGVCEELPITGWGGSRALPLFVLCCCVFVFQTKCVSERGQQLAACPPLITLELAMCSFSGCVPPSDFIGDKCMSGGMCVCVCVWEVRLEVVKGCVQAENAAAVICAPWLRFSLLFPCSQCVAGLILMPACVICPHIFTGFLTPVDKRHTHLSAATQPFVGPIFRGKNSQNESLPLFVVTSLLLIPQLLIILARSCLNLLNGLACNFINNLGSY